MTTRFTQLGFCVLRIDPEGLGDSEGEIEEFFTADVYGSMELGRLVNDTVDAMNWAQKNLGFDRFILSGLCGGAITGLLTGAMDKRVDALLSLGMTCIVTGSNMDPSQFITQGQLKTMRQKYFRKLMNFESWLRLISFRSDFKLMFKSLIQPLRSKLSRQTRQADIGKKTRTASSAPPDSNLNPHFPDAFVNFVRDRKILLIFSEADRLYWEFNEKFMAHYRDTVAPYQHNFSIQIVKNANHIFSFPEWQQEMLDLSTQWLTMLYGDALPSN
jgi:fermentation-respiration switch protein FrsA (DUF1100 family)